MKPEAESHTMQWSDNQDEKDDEMRLKNLDDNKDQRMITIRIIMDCKWNSKCKAEMKDKNKAERKQIW